MFDEKVSENGHSMQRLPLQPSTRCRKSRKKKHDPATQKPVLDKDGKPVTETVEVTRPAFKVVSVFDVSQTDGTALPDIAVDELTGSVENYAAFFDALKELSPAPIAFENIPDGAKGYFSHVENRIAIQEGHERNPDHQDGDP